MAVYFTNSNKQLSTLAWQMLRNFSTAKQPLLNKIIIRLEPVLKQVSLSYLKEWLAIIFNISTFDTIHIEYDL